MKETKQQIETNLNQLKKELKDFINLFVQGYDYTLMVYQFWNAKNILGHVTFWHQSFAKNVSDLDNNKIPYPLQGNLSEVNKLNVESTNAVTITELINRLNRAQNTIELYVFDEKIELIPYKKGSRAYSPDEHIQIMTNHIRKHLTDLKKKYGKTNK